MAVLNAKRDPVFNGHCVSHLLVTMSVYSVSELTEVTSRQILHRTERTILTHRLSSLRKFQNMNNTHL